jgi:hypothetical protein
MHVAYFIALMDWLDTHCDCGVDMQRRHVEVTERNTTSAKNCQVNQWGCVFLPVASIKLRKLYVDLVSCQKAWHASTKSKQFPSTRVCEDQLSHGAGWHVSNVTVHLPTFKLRAAVTRRQTSIYLPHVGKFSQPASTPPPNCRGWSCHLPRFLRTNNA